MRKLLILAVGVVVLSMPAAIFAGVNGTPHDMVGFAGTYATEELCFACHIPHGAQGDNLWGVDTSSAVAGMGQIELLCYTCHDGSAATTYDVFDKADGLIDHTMVGPGCSGTGACHDVHNQPAVGGDFLAEGIAASGSKCENCHDDTQFGAASAFGDHTSAGNHVVGGSSGLVCEDCHGAHTGVPQPLTAQSDKILVDTMFVSATNYGAMCVACHNNQAPFVGIISEVFDYAETQTNGTETKHPTIGGTYTLTGCNECHDVHALTDNGYLLNAAHHDADVDMCVTCHTATGNGAPGIGTGTHLTGDVSAWGGNPGTLPWSDGINDDGNAGADWSLASATTMVCETCHSIHKNGVGAPFLRLANTVENELCATSCHLSNAN